MNRGRLYDRNWFTFDSPKCFKNVSNTWSLSILILLESVNRKNKLLKLLKTNPEKGLCVDDIFSINILDALKHMILKNIHTHSLNLLSFVYIVVCDIETALENAKLAIALQTFFALTQPCWGTD